MTITQILYPVANADTVAITIGLASLASSSTLLAGRESTQIDNRTNRDLDHLLAGKIQVGTTPSVDTTIEVWVFAPIKIVSGTPTYPDVFDGTDSAETITSDGIKGAAVVHVVTLDVDATASDRDYPFNPVSISQLFNWMPPFWGVFVTHDTGVALNSTAGNHELHYHRIRSESA